MKTVSQRELPHGRCIVIWRFAKTLP